MNASRLLLVFGTFLLLLTAGAVHVAAQSGPDGAMSNDEVVALLLKGRPVGPRVLVMPQLFETLADTSTEQNAKNTPTGMAAWRDTYGKDGDDEYALRQFFVPMKAWSQKNAEQLLDEAARQLTEGHDTVLMAKKNYMLDDCPCRSFILRQPATGKWIRMDYIVVYPDLFTLSYTGTVAGLQTSKVVGFFTSVKTEPGAGVEPPPATSPSKRKNSAAPR